MPLEYNIDHARRVVVALGHGIVTDADFFAYQYDVWSRPDVAGYNELVDLTVVEEIALSSTGRLRQLAELSAKMDCPASKSKFAVVAPQDIAFGFGRMYATFRSMNDRSTKAVAIFRTLPEAFTFLGIEDDPPHATG